MADSLFHGVLRSNPSSSPRPASRRNQYSVVALPCDQGAIAPSPRLSSGLGISSSSSTSRREPIPSHAWQAPNGELNEKARGSIVSICRGWLLGQARFSLKLRVRSGLSSASSTKSISKRPSASRSAVSTESVRRWLMPSLMTMRSTTTSIVCLYCLASFGGSESCTVCPSTRAREYPWVSRSLKRSTNSPLRADTTGASTCTRVRSGYPMRVSTICCGVCLVISSPHSGQWACPTRAHSRRI